MTEAEIKEQELTQLSPRQRIALAEDLWASVRPEDMEAPGYNLALPRLVASRP